MPLAVAERLKLPTDAMTRKCGSDLLRDGDWREHIKRDYSPNSRCEQSSFHSPTSLIARAWQRFLRHLRGFLCVMSKHGGRGENLSSAALVATPHQRIVPRRRR